MKKKIVIATVILAGIFSLTIYLSKNKTVANQPSQKEILNVSAQTAGDSAKLVQTVSYPAITAGDQQITLDAGVSGTVTGLSLNLGDQVFEGKQLAVIDEIGNNSKIGDTGLKSSAIKALELSVEAAEENYKAAKRVYHDDDTYANKKAKEVAEINLDAAKANLKGALNSRFVVAPISGVITQKFVSEGDSISIGQPIASISKTALTKVQFYANREDLSNFKIGGKVFINEDGKKIAGAISRISPVADPATKRFLIEAVPAGNDKLLIGSVITVSMEIIRTPSVSGDLILPLAAITISQNENYIFIIENNHAKKITVSIEKVQGEYAEIKADIAPDAAIIVDGSKLAQDGEEVAVK